MTIKVHKVNKIHHTGYWQWQDLPNGKKKAIWMHSNFQHHIEEYSQPQKLHSWTWWIQTVSNRLADVFVAMKVAAAAKHKKKNCQIWWKPTRICLDSYEPS